MYWEKNGKKMESSRDLFIEIGHFSAELLLILISVSKLRIDILKNVHFGKIIFSWCVWGDIVLVRKNCRTDQLIKLKAGNRSLQQKICQKEKKLFKIQKVNHKKFEKMLD